MGAQKFQRGVSAHSAGRSGLAAVLMAASCLTMSSGFVPTSPMRAHAPFKPTRSHHPEPLEHLARLRRGAVSPSGERALAHGACRGIVRMGMSVPANTIKINWQAPDAAGGFGAVYFAQTLDGDDVVVKVALNDEFSVRLLENERYFNNLLVESVPRRQGRNWASYIGAFKIPANVEGFPEEVSRARALVFKKEEGTTLDNLLTSPDADFSRALSLPPGPPGGPPSLLRPALCRKVLGELLCGVVHLHARGIMHRDVKPENILVTPSDPLSPLKLIDLGSGCDLSTPLKRGLLDETIDPVYAPPELRVDMRHPDRYDSFCCAVTCLRVLMPSLGGDIGLTQHWSDDFKACGYDLRAWARRRAAEAGPSLTGAEARELLEPQHETLLALLAGMLTHDVAARTPPEAALARLGPVWAARLRSVETLSKGGFNTALAGGTASLRRTLSLLYVGVLQVLVRRDFTAGAVIGATARLGKAIPRVVPRLVASGLRLTLGVVGLALGKGWKWGSRTLRLMAEAY
eukprot:CAMPEP_0114151026 /NCGR_PEP_ID=MMETSP0043_2-20121206/23035_1 /TAXON_ID=464988 /ORGANISM="Hemiselmis andersenii, Strain CCMP644" /LENGTH=516 /DNA_ID=CAMNT_0001245833 /DNA_START=105 /DNA_END=1655 /DNA_ORIENTATION=+